MKVCNLCGMQIKDDIDLLNEMLYHLSRYHQINFVDIVLKLFGDTF